MNYNSIRRKTHGVTAGGVKIGSEAAISVQSMTNTDTRDFAATKAQTEALRDAGCDIVRIALPDMESVKTIAKLKADKIGIPLVADIHFDYKIALAAIEAGIDKIRINPGNIGSDDRVREVANAASAAGIPIRIGVNGGSLSPELLKKYGHPTAKALAESALYHCELLEKHGFSDIVVSIKSTDVWEMISANRILAKSCPYPLHIGVTEAGTEYRGTVKNAIGIGALLAEGIGDTVRVSLTADPVAEVAAAKEILSLAGVWDKPRLNIVSCPTCGRTRINLIETAKKFEVAAAEAGITDVPVKVAIMGCAVNGPGEAREADIGIAGGVGEALLFARGEIIRKIPENEIIETLIEEIKKLRTRGQA